MAVAAFELIMEVSFSASNLIYNNIVDPELEQDGTQTKT